VSGVNTGLTGRAGMGVDCEGQSHISYVTRVDQLAGVLAQAINDAPSSKFR
jgi:hypothetical protein